MDTRYRYSMSMVYGYDGYAIRDTAPYRTTISNKANTPLQKKKQQQQLTKQMRCRTTKKKYALFLPAHTLGSREEERGRGERNESEGAADKGSYSLHVSDLRCVCLLPTILTLLS